MTFAGWCAAAHAHDWEWDLEFVRHDMDTLRGSGGQVTRVDNGPLFTLTVRSRDHGTATGSARAPETLFHAAYVEMMARKGVRIT